MKLSINWLKELVDFELDHQQLLELFTTRSQEVESVEPLTLATHLLIGKVQTCEPHPKANKLSVCLVNIGHTTVQIVCGADNVAPGQSVIVALPGTTLPGGLTIEKTNIRGVESAGMICSLSELGIDYKYHHEDGIHVIQETVTPGEDALSALHFDDTILSLDLTPNRADLLSMHGVAYDIAAILEKTITLPEAKFSETDQQNPFKISTTTEKCMSYYGRVIENIVIKPSPPWLKARLIAAGIRPINNVVDITNYVMLETGQPLHAFDYDLLNSQTIIVREAKENESFTTLDDKVRRLKKGDILITNGKKPIALGGVMGGAETEVHQNTTRIFLESAVFDPMTIRKTSSRLDLRSESSTRFERGVDFNKTKHALNRATGLFESMAEGSVLKGEAAFDHHPQQLGEITLTLDKLNRVLGARLTISVVENILKRLRLPFEVQDETFVIQKISRRRDLESYQDIIEEIGRIKGYDSLPATLPNTISRGYLTHIQKKRRYLRTMLMGLGLDEAVTYNLHAHHQIKKYAHTDKSRPVTLNNPMSENRKTLALSRINGLLEAVSYNVARKQEDVALYELGKSFAAQGEKELLTIVMTGTHRGKGWHVKKPVDFFTVKGIFEALLDGLSLPSVRYEKTELNHYHPHQCALLYQGNTCIGHIGKLHPTTLAAIDLKDVYALEVETKYLYSQQEATKRYQPLQKFPSVLRDIAIICDEAIPAAKIIHTVYEIGGTLMKSADIFDVYQSEKLKENQKSLAIRMMFEDSQQTLKAERVDRLIEDIIAALKKQHGIVLR